MPGPWSRRQVSGRPVVRSCSETRPAASQQLLAPCGPVWWMLGNKQAGQVLGVALAWLGLLVTGKSVFPWPQSLG